ncbi:hypothetical protein HPB52_000497 [Rhipicephalus sanguineus]|uniref:Uncharacterized protein n=1 Tax=Rhipicephalus sanguineus TaxID=34632 RepID=A0A9D4SMV6_RHISA|nr:hypothetical protein HPB52_000497 [Rhipicephalus sanguineus]
MKFLPVGGAIFTTVSLRFRHTVVRRGEALLSHVAVRSLLPRMSMHVTVDGEDITAEECLESGWTTAISKRKSQSQPDVNGRESATQHGSEPGGSRTPPPASSRNASPRPQGSPACRGSNLGSSSAPVASWMSGESARSR